MAASCLNTRARVALGNLLQCVGTPLPWIEMVLLHSCINGSHLLDSTLQFAWHSASRPWDMNTDFIISTLGESRDLLWVTQFASELQIKCSSRFSESLKNFILITSPTLYKVWGHNRPSSAWNMLLLEDSQPPALLWQSTKRRKILLLFWKDPALDVNLSFKKSVSLFLHHSFRYLINKCQWNASSIASPALC